MIRQVAALLRRALAVIVELKWQQQLTVIPCHPVKTEIVSACCRAIINYYYLLLNKKITSGVSLRTNC